MKSKIEQVFEKFEKEYNKSISKKIEEYQLGDDTNLPAHLERDRDMVVIGLRTARHEFINSKEWNQLKSEILKIVEELEKENKELDKQVKHNAKELLRGIVDNQELEKQLKEQNEHIQQMGRDEEDLKQKIKDRIDSYDGVEVISQILWDNDKRIRRLGGKACTEITAFVIDETKFGIKEWIKQNLLKDD